MISRNELFVTSDTIS